MVFIIAYRLKRKNARRKVQAKIYSVNIERAVEQFNHYCTVQDKEAEKPVQWELLTGDWKHITFYEREAKG